MFLSLFSPKSGRLFVRGLHLAKQFPKPSTEDIVFRAICVNLRQKKWKFLDSMLPSITSSIVFRVFHEFQSSPLVVLEFYYRIGGHKYVLDTPTCCGIVIHLMVNGKKYDEALCLVKELMIVKGYSPLDVLKTLLNSYGLVFSSCAAFETLVRACTQMGSTKGAYEVIKQLRVQGFQISIHAWNNFLSHLLKLDDVAQFWIVHKEMISYGYFENVNTFNLIIYALCKEYRLLEAISVFYTMLKNGIMPNDVALNMLIDGACWMGDCDLALKLIRKIGTMSNGCVTPDSISYNSLINGYCKLGSMVTAENFLDEMLKRGIQPNLRTYATLVDGYSRNGCLEEAFRLCNKMVERGLMPNSVVYNSVIHWLYMEGDLSGASLLLADMIKRDISPDKYTYSILANGLFMNGRMNEALKYYKWILENNLIEDVFPHNIVINCLCRNKNICEVNQILCNMFVRGLIPDVATYGSLIDSYCKAGNMENALQIYNDMIVVEKSPNLVVYNSILDGLCKWLSVDAGKTLLDGLKSAVLYDVITFNTLLNGYCTGGKVEDVLHLLSSMRKEGISFNKVTFNILINFLCRLGTIEQAKKLVDVMLAQGFNPDCVTYTTLVTSAINKCQPEEVIELHDYMVLGGVIPDNQTYQTIVAPLTERVYADMT